MESVLQEGGGELKLHFKHRNASPINTTSFFSRSIDVDLFLISEIELVQLDFRFYRRFSQIR